MVACDIEEELKRAKIRLQKAIDTANTLEGMGQPASQVRELREYATRMDERIKVYEEIIAGKLEVQTDIPDSLRKLRDLYQAQRQI